MDSRSSWDNYLVLDYRRTLNRFTKLHDRYLKRRRSKSFEKLSRKKQYYLIRKLRKLKSKLDQLLLKMKLGVAAGTIAASILLTIDDVSAQSYRSSSEQNTVNTQTSGIQDQVAMDANADGQIVLVWRDVYGGDIKAQRFNPDKEPLGGEITIASSVPDNTYSDPDVAIDGNGDFVVVYERNYSEYIEYDTYSYNNYLEIRRYDNTGTLSAGSPVNHTLTLYTADGASSTTDEAILPSISMNESGDFVLAWQTLEDESGSQYTAHVNTFFDGTWGTSEILDVSDTAESKSPSVAITESGNYVVSWAEEMSFFSDQKYFGIKYRRGGLESSLGGEIIGFNAGFPTILTPTVDDPLIRLMENGDLIVSFFDAVDSEIRNRRFDSNDVFLGFDYFSASNYTAFDLQVDEFGNRYYAYASNSSLRFRTTDHFGNSYSSPSSISQSSINSAQVNLLGDDFVVGFNGNFSEDVFIQYFSRSIPVAKKDDGLKINDDPSVREFRVSETDSQGNFVVVWEEDPLTAERDIWAQQFNSSGEKVGTAIRVTDETDMVDDQIPRVSMSPDGDFAVGWFWGSYIRVQLFNSSGATVGNTFTVNTSSVSATSYFDISLSDDQGIVIFDQGSDHIVSRKFDGANSFLSTDPVSVIDWTNNLRFPSVAMDDDGDAMVIYSQDFGDYNYLYGSVIPSAATEVSVSFAVETDGVENLETEIIASGNDEFLISWQGPNGFTRFKNTSIDGNGKIQSIDISGGQEDLKSISDSPDEILLSAGRRIVSLDENFKLLGELSDFGLNDINSVLADGRFYIGIDSNNDIYIREMLFQSPNQQTRGINKGTGRSQELTSIARNDNGDYVIVWDNFDEGGGARITAQRFNNNHQRVGDTITISTRGDIETLYNSQGNDLQYSFEQHRYPDVFMSEDGDFTVVWDGYLYNPYITLRYGGLFHRTFDAQEESLTDTKRIYATDPSDLISAFNIPRVDADANGNFVVAWTHSEYYGSETNTYRLRYQQFDNAGTPINEPISVVSPFQSMGYFYTSQIEVDVDESGDFAVAYTRSQEGSIYLTVAKVPSDGNGSWDWGQNFYAEGEHYVQLDSNDPYPDVTILPDGTVAFVYVNADGNIEFRIISSDGQTVSDATQPFNITNDDLPKILSNDLGIAVLAVERNEGDAIELARYALDGSPLAGAQSVSYASFIKSADMDIDDSGDIMVAWTSESYNFGYGKEVFAKEIFTPFPKVEVSEINVIEEEIKELQESLSISDNFGSNDWDFQVLVPSSYGTTTVGSLTLAEGSTFLGSDVETNGITYSHVGVDSPDDLLEFEIANVFGYKRSVEIPISVTNVNDQPITELEITNQETNEDEAFNFSIPNGTFSDEETSPLSYAAELQSGANLPGWLSLTGDSFTGTPLNEDVGVLNLRVIASDGELSTTADFDLTVINVNDAPTAGDIEDQSATEDVAFSFDLSGSFSDPDVGDQLTYSAAEVESTELPSWLSINSSSGELSGTPANADVGSVEIIVTATDASSATASGTVKIEVANANDGPVVQPIADQNTAEDSPFTFDVSGLFSDDDTGDVLTYSAKQEDGNDLPSWLTLDSSTGQFSGTPTNENVGTLFVEVTGTDGAGASVSDVFAIEVANVNDAPDIIGSIEAQTAIEGENFSFEIKKDELFADVDSPGISIELKQSDFTDLPNWLSFDSETGILSGTPSEGDVGELEIRVIASDGETVTSISFLLTIQAGEKLGLSQESIVVYPNPTDSYVQFDWEDQSEKLIRIYDYQGKISKEFRVSTERRIDVSTLPDGNYVLSIERERVKVASFKLVIKHNK